jgi:hypothetical protein
MQRFVAAMPGTIFLVLPETDAAGPDMDCFPQGGRNDGVRRYAAASLILRRRLGALACQVTGAGSIDVASYQLSFRDFGRRLPQVPQ